MEAANKFKINEYKTLESSRSSRQNAMINEGGEATGNTSQTLSAIKKIKIKKSGREND